MKCHQPEVTVDHAVRSKEVPGSARPLHLPLSVLGRPMRTRSAIVQVPARPRATVWQHGKLSDAVAAQAIGDGRLGSNFQLVQQALEESLGGRRIPSVFTRVSSMTPCQSSAATGSASTPSQKSSPPGVSAPATAVEKSFARQVPGVVNWLTGLCTPSLVPSLSIEVTT
jgi:hypothetical protein